MASIAWSFWFCFMIRILSASYLNVDAIGSSIRQATRYWLDALLSSGMRWSAEHPASCTKTVLLNRFFYLLFFAWILLNSRSGCQDEGNFSFKPQLNPENSSLSKCSLFMYNMTPCASTERICLLRLDMHPTKMIRGCTILLWCSSFGSCGTIWCCGCVISSILFLVSFQRIA